MLEKLGQIGIWSGALRRVPEKEAAEAAKELERLGFGTLWMPGGGPGIFERVRALLSATSYAVVATGIVNIWNEPATAVSDAYRAITADFPGRFLLGLGVSHGHAQTYNAMVEYLNALDSSPHPVPTSERVLAALGPRMLGLARDRAAGAHPYNVPVSHTLRARQTLGSAPLLIPEQAVVVEMDPARARATARQFLGFYLQAPNYTNNFLREGFDAGDLANGGTDRLIDAIVAWGDISAIRRRTNDHLSAGATQVCIQVISDDRDALPITAWQSLAAGLKG